MIKEKEISLLRNFLNNLQTSKSYTCLDFVPKKYCILTRWGDRIAKCRSQVKATIKRTDAHIATCPNASMIPRTVLNESEIETAKSKRESFEKKCIHFCVRYLNLPFFTPKAWMQEKVLQKMKKVSTMQSTASN